MPKILQNASTSTPWIPASTPWAPGAKKASGPYTGGPPKGLLHATIAPSTALPDYAGQSMAPHETLLWDPVSQKLSAYQHYYFNNFAKALVNAPGGVETNRDTTLQWELAGYLGANGATVPSGEFDILTAPNTYWEQAADHIGPVLQSWAVLSNIYVGPRMGYSQWDNYSGLCTHAHVPENTHWDLPIPANAMSILSNKLWTNPAPPVVVVRPAPVPNTGSNLPTFPLPTGHAFGPKTGPSWQHSGYYSASDRNYLRMWQAQMRNRGWKIDVDGLYGNGTATVAKQFQQEKNLRPVDGLIGIDTWNAAWTMRVT